MGKYVTISFYTSPRRYEKDMEKAKIALLKTGDSGVDEGDLTIDSVKIKIENTTSGMC